MIYNVLNKCNCAENNSFISSWLVGRALPEDVAGDLIDDGVVHRTSKQRNELNRILEAGTILMMMMDS